MTAKKVMAFCEMKVKAMIDEARQLWTGHPRQPKLPLIRLRVDCSIPNPFSINQFGLQFSEEVANPADILRFRLKHKTISADGKVVVKYRNMDSLAEAPENRHLTNIEDVVDEFFSQMSGDHQMTIANHRVLTESVRSMVEKDIKDAVTSSFDGRLDTIRQTLRKDFKILEIRRNSFPWNQ